MPKATPIYPMSMTPRTNITADLYFVGFPAEWKQQIYDIYIIKNPKHREEYNLNTSKLNKNIEAWLDRIADVSAISKNSDDTHWLVAAEMPNLDKLCEIIKFWIAAEYIADERISALTATTAQKLIESITPDKLQELSFVETVRLFDENGRAAHNYSFKAFPLLAASNIIGKTLDVFGTELVFCRAGNELVSFPIQTEKGAYSYVIKLSVQTTPPERRCMLNVKCTIRRYISKTWRNMNGSDNNIRALVRAGDYTFRSIPIMYSRKEGTAVWDSSDKVCYDLYNLNPLPNAVDVLQEPTKHLGEECQPQLLLPYAIQCNLAEKPHIGSGVSVKDKAVLFEQISKLLKDFAKPIASPERIKSLVTKTVETPDIRRQRLVDITEMRELTFEIYANSGNDIVVSNLKNSIAEFFGVDEDLDAIMKISVQEKPLDSLGDAMEDSKCENIMQRIAEIECAVKKSSNTVAFVLLPDQDKFNKGDPKKALRAGFADTGRLTQFITPEVDNAEHKARSAFKDMLRQLGYTERFDDKLLAKYEQLSYDIIGVHTFTQLEPVNGKTKFDRARFLPIYVIYNPTSGKVSVRCDLFPERTLPYHKALLKLSELSRNSDFVDRCNETAYGSIKQNLLGLNNLYRDKGALLFVQASGNTRSLWSGISDSSIGDYQFSEDYIPSEIDIGKKGSEYPIRINKGLRIIRIRLGDEVPDYYTEKKPNGGHSSASGVFRYKSVFWLLEQRTYNSEYTDSEKYSKTDRPNLSFDEHSLVEVYPLQLHNGDDPLYYAAFTDKLRAIMPEYDQTKVKLPAPLHFAKKMEEYLLIK